MSDARKKSKGADVAGGEQIGSKSATGGVDAEDSKAAYVARQLDHEKIGVLTDRVEKLLKSNTLLRNGASQNEKNAHDVEMYYRREMEVKDDIIVRLNEELVKRDSQLKMEIDKMKRKFDSDLNDLRLGTESIITDLRMRLSASEKDLLALEAYRKDRDLHDERQRNLERMLQEKDAKMAEALEEQERKFFEEKAHIFKDLDKRKDVLREIALKEAREAMGTEAKKIVADNDRMFEELKFLHSSTADLEADKSAIQQQLMESKREISILVEKELEYAKQAHYKNREIADLRNRVELLEKQHAINLEKFRQHAQDLRSSVSQDLETASVDAAGLRRLLNLKNHELRQMKALATTILEQRSETEQFFMEALNEVKEAMRVERRQRQRALELVNSGNGGSAAVAAVTGVLRSKSFGDGDGGGLGTGGGLIPGGSRRSNTNSKQQRGTGRSGRTLRMHSTGMLRLPALHVRDDQVQDVERRRDPQRIATPDNETVHIRDLSWPDKELVLRVLFAKLNQSKRQTEKKAAQERQRQQKLIDLADAASRGEREREESRGAEDQNEAENDQQYPFFVSEGALGEGDFVPNFLVQEMQIASAREELPPPSSMINDMNDIGFDDEAL